MIHGALIKFNENFSAGNKKPYGGSYIKETDGFCAALPVTLKLAGDSDVLTKAEDVIKTLSTWPTAVKHGVVACNIILKIVSGIENPINAAMKEAIDTHPEAAKSLAFVQKNLDVDHVDAVGFGFGRPCYNPGSFQGAVHAYMQSDDYATAVRSTIRAGGCNCSRAFFIGAMAGATFGIDGIPKDWMIKAKNAESVLETSIKIFKNQN